MGVLRTSRRYGFGMRGLVLAGGKSSRFGSDKALMVYEGTTFLERAVSLLGSMDLKPIVVTRRGMVYPWLPCATLYDQLPEKGPLGGLYTAMSRFKKTSFVVLTCDMPALTPGVLQGLLDRHEPSRLLTFYSTPDGFDQPFPGIYEDSLFGVIKEKIKMDDLSLHGLLDGTPTRKRILWKGSSAFFRNINYREDLVV